MPYMFVGLVRLMLPHLSEELVMHDLMLSLKRVEQDEQHLLQEHVDQISEGLQVEMEELVQVRLDELAQRLQQVMQQPQPIVSREEPVGNQAVQQIREQDERSLLSQLEEHTTTHFSISVRSLRRLLLQEDGSIVLPHMEECHHQEQDEHEVVEVDEHKVDEVVGQVEMVESYISTLEDLQVVELSLLSDELDEMVHRVKLSEVEVVDEVVDVDESLSKYIIQERHSQPQSQDEQEEQLVLQMDDRVPRVQQDLQEHLVHLSI